MSLAGISSRVVATLVVLLNVLGTSAGRQITIKNSCQGSIWPATLTSDGGSVIPNLPGNFWDELKTGGTLVLNSVPESWKGRIWGRTVCDGFGQNKVACLTGDCNDGAKVCTASGQPATLAELNFSEDGDSYDVSVVDGFNIPMTLTPSDSSCRVGECSGNINAVCPPALVAAVQGDKNYACFTACKKGLAQGTYTNLADVNHGKVDGNRDCCSGIFGTPHVCGTTQQDYMNVFKQTCQGAYSFAYDDGTSLWSCGSKPSYTIEFCPGSDKTFTGPSGGSQQYVSDLASNASWVPEGFGFVSYANGFSDGAVPGTGSGAGSGGGAESASGSGSGTGGAAGTTAATSGPTSATTIIQQTTATATTWVAPARVGTTAGGLSVGNEAIAQDSNGRLMVDSPTGGEVQSVTVTSTVWVMVTSTSSGLAGDKRTEVARDVPGTAPTVTQVPSYTTLLGRTITSGSMFTIESIVLEAPPTGTAAVYLRPTFGGALEAGAAKRVHQDRRGGGSAREIGGRWH